MENRKISKSPTIRNGNTNRVKKLVSEFTEIKRPTGKNRNDCEGSEFRTTLPKRTKQTRSTALFGENRRSNGCSTTKRHTSLSFLSSNASSLSYSERHEVDEETSDFHFEEIASRFGELLKPQRQIHTSSNDEIDGPNKDEEKHDTTEDSSEEQPSSTNSQIPYETDPDDMFELFIFDESNNDNYVLEAYNKEGDELMKTVIEITQMSIKIQETSSEQLEEFLNEDLDFAIREFDSHLLGFCNNYSYFNNGIRQPGDNFYHSESSLSDNECLSNYHQHTNRDKIGVQNMETLEQQEISEEVSIDINHQELHNHDVSSSSNCSQTDVEHPSEDSSEERATASKRKEKIEYIIEEMVKTEEMYVAGLKFIVENYMEYLNTHTPNSLLGKTVYLFGNINKIYEKAQLFLKTLKENCAGPDAVAQVFIDLASAFDLYPMYSKNKPKADTYLKDFSELVKARQKELNDKLGLASYLLSPIQRLGKYVLMLQHIQKELVKKDLPVDKIGTAINIIKSVMRKGNDIIAIDSIKYSSVDLTLHGSFIMRAVFNILKPKKFSSMVFLFDNIVVFTVNGSKSLEEFIYVDSIPMSDLSLSRTEDKPNIFRLTNYTKSKRAINDATYVLEAETDKIKEEWTSAIWKKLWVQLEAAKELQNEINSTESAEIKKPAQKPRPSTNNTRSKKRSKSSSTFYDHSCT